MARGVYTNATNYFSTGAAGTYTPPARPFTIAAWSNITSIGAGSYACIGGMQSIAQAYYLIRQSTGLIETYSQAVVASTSAPTLGSWVLTGFSCEASGGDNTIKIYIGSNLDKTGTAVGGGAPNAANRFAAGYDLLNADFAANGYLAHIAVWSMALTAADFLALLTARPSLVQAASLVDYWTMQETSGNCANSVGGRPALAQVGTVGYLADGLYGGGGSGRQNLARAGMRRLQRD